MCVSLCIPNNFTYAETVENDFSEFINYDLNDTDLLSETEDSTENNFEYCQEYFYQQLDSTNKYCYEIGPLNNDDISVVILDLNGKFAFAANFPFRIHLGYTTNGKAKFTLKDGDTIYINEKEIDTNAFYEIYINVYSEPAIRKI